MNSESSGMIQEIPQLSVLYLEIRGLALGPIIEPPAIVVYRLQISRCVYQSQVLQEFH